MCWEIKIGVSGILEKLWKNLKKSFEVKFEYKLQTRQWRWSGHSISQCAVGPLRCGPVGAPTKWFPVDANCSGLSTGLQLKSNWDTHQIRVHKDLNLKKLFCYSSSFSQAIERVKWVDQLGKPNLGPSISIIYLQRPGQVTHSGYINWIEFDNDIQMTIF